MSVPRENDNDMSGLHSDSDEDEIPHLMPANQHNSRNNAVATRQMRYDVIPNATSTADLPFVRMVQTFQVSNFQRESNGVHSQSKSTMRVTPATHQLNMRESRIAADRAARECYGVLRPHIRSHCGSDQTEGEHSLTY